MNSLALLAAVLLAPPTESTAAVTLFDGKTLAGWEAQADLFRVADGAIVAGSADEKIKQNEFLCTKKRYADFELTFEAKLTGQGTNAGVQFRSERVPDHHEMIGYQCDIGRAGKTIIWGGLYDESRRRKFLALGDQSELAKVIRQADWNRLRVRAEGKRIQIWINEVQTVDYTETDPKIPLTGLIGLQIHSGPPAEASYRKIKLVDLSEE